MPQRILGLLFDAGGKNRIQAVLDLGALVQESDLERTVGKIAPFELPSLRIDPRDGELSVFGYPLQVESKGLTCRAEILAPGASKDPFGTGELLVPAEGSCFARLAVDAGLTVKGKAAGTNGALQLSAEGAAAAGLTYEHILPVAGDKSLVSAFTRLVGTTQLPQFARLERLTPAEALVFDGDVRLDFGAKVRAGAALDIEDVVRPFGRLELPVQAHVRFTAEAAVGWSLYERMRLVVVRGLTTDPGWVRVRLDRQSQRTFTLGARFDLGVQYDAAKGLEAILDEAFDLVPKGRAIELLRGLATTPWGRFRDQIAGEAAETLTAYVDATGWKEWLAGSEDVGKLTSAAKTFVKAYDGLDERVQELWTELLGRAGTGSDSKFRKHLDQIADLNLDELDAASHLPSSLGKAWNLLEMLIGQDLEHLLLEGAPATKRALQEAIDRAGALRKFLDDAPDSVIQGIQRVAGRTGIAALASWLEENATSVEDLQRSASALTTKLVRRLAGKALEEISDSDVARLKATATDLVALLDKTGALETRLRKEVGRLRGEWKGSLTLGFSSETKSEGLLDIELDPSHGKVRGVVEEGLRSGHIAKLLAGLDKLDASDAFRIRACRLTSSRIRRTATSLLLSWLPDAVEISRIEESVVEIQGKSRNYRFTGGAQRRVTDAAESIARATIGVEAKGTGLNLDAPCKRGKVTLDVAFTREDDKTTSDELAALDGILDSLGFLDGGDAKPSAVVGQTGVHTSLFAGLRFSEKALEAVFGGIDRDGGAGRWRQHFEEASIAWYGDGLVQRGDVKLGPVGDVLGTVLQSPQFQAIWTAGIWPAKTVVFPVGNRSVKSRDAILLPLRTLVPSMAFSAEAARKLELPDSDTTPAELRDFTKQAAKTLKAASAGDWPSPLFTLWLVKTRLTAENPGLWRNATGVATLRWRQSEGMEWSDPVTWTR